MPNHLISLPRTTRRAVLAAGLGSIIAPTFAKAVPPPNPSLASLAASRRLIFGTAAATYELRDADYSALLAREVAMLVPEYEMNRKVVEPEAGSYDFSGIDALLAFARVHHIAFRGHPLVWYNANPPWLEEAVLSSRNEKLLTGYVTALAGRYRGRMHSLDVVNEALAQPGDGDNNSSGLRQSFWLKAFGPSYIDLAFYAARAADPGALLVYNDYGCEPGDAAGDAVRANCLKLLDGMLARGVPVQALGMQSHLFAFGVKVDQAKLRNFLTEIAARKLVLLVTELDVNDEGGAWDIAARDSAVADTAARFLDVVLDCSNLQAVLTWGLSDRYVDPPQSLRLKMTGWRDREFPYDSSLTPKPFRAALARAFSGH
jgi:endo-1,4-beta-xylanase